MIATLLGTIFLAGTNAAIYSGHKEGCPFYDKVVPGYGRELLGCFPVGCKDGKLEIIPDSNGPPHKVCSTCYVDDSSEVKTFDRDTTFLWEKKTCSYLLAQHSANSGKRGSFCPHYSISGDITTCGTKGACNGAVRIVSGTTEINIRRSRGIIEFQDLAKDETWIPRSELPSSDRPGPNFIRVAGTTEDPVLMWTVDIAGCIRFVSKKFSGMVNQTDVNVYANPEQSEKLTGLCGFYDGNPNNDLTDRFGRLQTTDIDTYGYSWLTGDQVNADRCRCEERSNFLSAAAMMTDKSIQENTIAH